MTNHRNWHQWVATVALIAVMWGSFDVLSQSKRAPKTKATVPSEMVAADAGASTATITSVNPDARVVIPTSDAAMPWAGAEATQVPSVDSLPSFLDTKDNRIKDTRLPPTESQKAALKEMQKELAAFGKAAGSYRAIVDSIVKREYLRRRQTRDSEFAVRINQEEKLLNDSRLDAIKLFEQFLARYPHEQRYTPDAMFRLGELYYERSAIQFQQMLAQRDSKENSADGGVDDSVQVERRDTPDFTPTIELYARLVRDFPDYRNIGGVYYLMGYCLNEMGQPDEARMAWLNLACANHFTFKPVPPATSVNPDEVTEEEKREAKIKQYPALGLDAKKSNPAENDNGPYVDPYADCRPVQANAQFLAETWLRVGEYHFDFDYGAHGLDRAISAYGKLMNMPEDRNFNLALYKLAWSHYRASRYAESMKYFARLVQWSDEEEKRTGKAGTELRAEAVQYMALTLAYDDWNENQVPDIQEGLPSGYERLQDKNLLPQDQPWTPEIYFQVGNVFFEEVKYADAIKIWELTLKKFPLHEKAPEVVSMISKAYQRNNQTELAIETRSKLLDYVEGTPWWNANLTHPDAQQKAEALAEKSLVNTAVAYHTKAQALRRQGLENRDTTALKQAQDAYQLAAQAYRLYLKRYSNSPQSYELHYNLADTLYWSEKYEEAAAEYAAVRDSNLDDTYLSESARRVVESLKRIIDKAVEDKKLEIRDTPPAPQVVAEGKPPQVMPIQMPELLQRMAQARQLYLARVDDAHDTEHVRESYDYNNALLLYNYGYWFHAKERFTRIYRERCIGSTADETGRISWLNLRNMAVVAQDLDSVEALGQDLAKRKCTFDKSGTAVAVDCSQPKNREEPQCLAGQDLTNIKYVRAVDVFGKAEKAQGKEQQRLYEQASEMLVKAVNDEPNHPQAPLALEKAAIALERIDKFESAARLYQRVIDEIGPRKPKDEKEEIEFDAILANAYFRLAYNANRFFEYEKAVENYRILADSARFEKSKDPQMRERREGALINAATILEYEQEYKRAANYYRRAAEVLKDPQEQMAARYRVAEMAFKQQNWKAATGEMNQFIAKYQNDKKAGELLVQANWRIAQDRKALNIENLYKKQLVVVVDQFARSGQPPGSLAAEYAAQARFEIVDEGSSSFESFAIKPGKPKTMQDYIKEITSQIEKGSKEAKERAEKYATVLEYRRPTWTIGAFVRQGRIYEVLAKAVLNTPFIMPKDLAKKIEKAPEEAKEQVRIQVEDAVRQTLDKQVRPIECLAVVRYALAARAAKAGSLDNAFTQQAVDRLQAYGDERIGECISEAAAKDKSFGAYVPGEFSRALRGQNLELPKGIASPPLPPP